MKFIIENYKRKVQMQLLKMTIVNDSCAGLTPMESLKANKDTPTCF